MEKPILSVKDLHTNYRTRNGENVYAVSGISFDLFEGRILGIAGESGCGKSTLAQSLFGLYEPPLHYGGGSIRIGDLEVTGLDKESLRTQVLGSRIAYIPQAAMNALNPTLKVIRFIEDFMREHDPKLSRQRVYELAKERFERLNLPERALNAYANELSGGMKQRVVIAVSTMLNPDILIADEPTSALDVSSQKVVMRMIKELLGCGFIKSLVFITHELPLLYHIADDIMVMYAGEVVETGSSRQIVFESIHPYSKALMASIMVPEEEQKGNKPVAIPGAPPNLKHKLTGCRFADRCSLADDLCKAKNIPLKDLGNGRFSRCRRGGGNDE